MNTVQAPYVSIPTSNNFDNFSSFGRVLQYANDEIITTTALGGSRLQDEKYARRWHDAVAMSEGERDGEESGKFWMVQRRS